ncbi:uncharacterized protein LOC110859006 [Folsomia candida]|uniref:uncharacterized protein LOC110859006 n=1 Tax=Folsomia candida TaxID=158441 RepID=UPI000B8EFAFA|nr:uncharacterized protein LOC110859006 [Folsomia candida]
MKLLAIVLLSMMRSALGGVVTFQRCGGTLTELRVENCEGSTCRLNPGTLYITEGDLIPSSASSQLHLKVTTTYFTGEVTIIDTNLDDSSVQPGQTYTIRFTIVPNDVLAGSTLPIRATISDVASGRVEICAHFQVFVNFPQ